MSNPTDRPWGVVGFKRDTGNYDANGVRTFPTQAEAEDVAERLTNEANSKVNYAVYKMTAFVSPPPAPKAQITRLCN